MQTDTPRLKAPIGNGAFSVFVFSILGWALIEAWCVAIAAPIAFQILAALIGIAIAAIGCRRYRAQWPALPPEQVRSNGMRKFGVACGCLLVVITGNVLGRLALSQFISPMLVFAMGLTFVPWSRVPLCRRNFFKSSILFVSGAAYPLVFSTISTDPIHLLAAAWALWSVACIALLHKY